MFGFHPTTGCGGKRVGSWVRVSADTDVGIANSRFGVSSSRAGKLFDGGTFFASSAEAFVYDGQAQAVVMLINGAQVAAQRPADGGLTVALLNDGIEPTYLVTPDKSLGYGRSLSGGFDVTGDGVADLAVTSPGANLNGDGTGAVYIYSGKTLRPGLNFPWLTVASDFTERASFGQDVSLVKAKSQTPAGLVIGAPLSYRTGTANGTAYVLPLNF
jgi:FG-GAP repeat